MKKDFGAEDWREKVPVPVCGEHPEYLDFYYTAWGLAFKHIKSVHGMPQDPYMDEAFCATQVWIWDSCFMSLFCKFSQSVFPGIETLTNFYEVLHGTRRLPRVLPPKGEPEWTGAVYGVPYEIKVHIADNPPLFAWAEYENALMSGDAEHVRELLYESRVLQKHYFWLESLREEQCPDGVLAPTCLIAEPNGYRWEGGRSGMDNTPRGRCGEHATRPRPNNPNMLWIDAICQQALSALMMARLFELVGDGEAAREWRRRHAEKSAIINELYWCEDDGFFYDIDRTTHEPYKVRTIASFWALTAECAPRERAERLAALIDDPAEFGGDFPLVSLSRSDADFAENGKYWRGSVWLPTAYATLKGLATYGLYETARRAAEKLLAQMYATYTDVLPHTIWECYSPTEPKPGVDPYDGDERVRGDFCGWSALGPISIYIEFVLGFHTINAFERLVRWAKPESREKLGIKRLCFGDVTTDIVAEGERCTVSSNAPYTLEIDGVRYAIEKGENVLTLQANSLK